MTTDAQRYLNAAAYDLAWAQSVIGDRIRSAASITPDGWPDRTSTAERAEATSSSRIIDPEKPESWPGPDYSDPTGDAAAARERTASRVQALDLAGQRLYEATQAFVKLLGDVPSPPVDTSKDASRARCDGGAGDWADPTCENLAVTTVRVNGVEHQLCWPCEGRRRKAS